MNSTETTLGDLMTANVKTITPDVTLSAAAQLMADFRFSCLVVVQDGQAAGILTERDLVKLLHDRVAPSKPVSAIMSSPVVTAHVGDTFRDGLQLMHQFALRHLVMVDDNNRVCGIVSESNLRSHLGLDIVGKVRNLQAAMDRKSPIMLPDTSLNHALEHMIRERWDYVVVVEGEHALGIITERDIARLITIKADADALTLNQVMSSPVKTIEFDVSLFEAVKRMSETQLRHLVVVDGQHRFVGVISQHGLLERIGLEFIGDNLHELELLRAGRIAAEKALHDREEIYSTIVNQAADSIVLFDSETLKFIEFNSAAHEGLGYTREEFSQLTLLDIQVVLSRDQVMQRIRQAIENGGNLLVELSHRRKDGSIRLTRVSSRPVRIRGTTYLAAIWSDITERKLAEEELRKSEARYRFIADNTEDVIWLMDIRTGKFTYVSPSVEKLRGYTAEEVMAQPMEAALTPESSQRVKVELANSLAELAAGTQQRLVNTTEVDQPCRDGSIVHTEVVTKYLFDSSGAVTTVLGVTRDITLRRRTEEQSRLAISVFRDASEGIMISDAKGILLDVNQAFTAISGYAHDEAVGKPTSLLRSGRQDKAFYTKLWSQLLQTEHWSGELWNQRKNGEVFAEQLSISAVKDANGEVTHYVGIFTDITEQKRQQEQIERLAYYDALTLLPNRVLLADRMQQAIAHADRSKGIFAVCYLDLDGFKPINDRYGHKAGDSVLVEIAKRLQELIRVEDTVARLGGDEFVLLLTGLSKEEESTSVLLRLLEIVTQPCQLGGNVQVSVSASIGVTFYPADRNDSDVLLRHADQAMYQAKQLGRNRTHSFDPIYDQQASKLRDLKSSIRMGLSQGSFVLHWQPKVDLIHGHVVGAEALLRWKQTDGSVMLPGAFLPELENDDLIVEIGDFVIREGVATLARWQELGLDLSASVNVAARQMLSHDFLPKLRVALEGRACVAARLELEILETAALEDLGKVKRLINECRALGVSTALDDFGTGYSSMTYFRRLPVDTVKIDQSFVRDMLDNTDDLAIVQGILGLTKVFGKTSVAEGVELIEHLATLQSLGCHIAQGYAIGYPMAEEEFLRWLKNYQPNPAWVKPS